MKKNTLKNSWQIPYLLFELSTYVQNNEGDNLTQPEKIQIGELEHFFKVGTNKKSRHFISATK